MIIDCKIGDIVEIPSGFSRLGYVVGIRKRGCQVGVRYFKPHQIKGTPTDFIWWIHASNVKVISGS